jgi:hypothetical protein
VDRREQLGQCVRTLTDPNATSPPTEPATGPPTGGGLPREEGPIKSDHDLRAVWASCLSSLEIDENAPVLRAQRQHGRRVYGKGASVFKIVAKGAIELSHEYRNDLPEEWQLLQATVGIPGVVQGERFIDSEQWHAIVMKRYAGTRLDETSLTFDQLLRALPGLFYSLWALSMRGISHNDVLPRNVLVRECGSPLLLDFDQASEHDRVIALYRNFIGLNCSDDRPYGSFLTFLASYIASRLSTGLYARIRTQYSRQVRHGRNVERRRLDHATGDPSV